MAEDRGSRRLVSTPLYKRAEAEMVARIAGGDWAPGERLPNEFDLADEFGVSQGTIRKALGALERRGLLARSPGRGTTVVKTTDEAALYAFFPLRKADGELATPKPIHETVTRRAATDEEAAVLQPEGADVFVLSRVRAHEGRPLAVEEAVFCAHRFAGLDAATPLPSSLYPFLQSRFGVSIMTAEESIAATAADAPTARALEVAVGAPLLLVSRTSRDLTEQAVEMRTSLYLTEFAQYRVSLSR